MKTLNDYLHAKASRSRIPLDGTFELSPVCNFSCKMCYVRKTPAQIRQEGKTLIPPERWLELARECKDAGMLYLLLTGGEPFLYPGFRELYVALHEMGLVLSINSNGTMIDEQTVSWLKKHAPSRINITLYGASGETYKRICGDETGYARATRAIEMLKEAGIPVVINATMIPENGDDLEKIARYGKSLGLNTRITTYAFPPVRRERASDDSRFTPEQGAQMYLRKAKCAMPNEDYCKLLERQLDQDDSESWGASRDGYMACRAGRSAFWISWDGKMTACGIMPFPLVEKPFENPFSDCWSRLTEAVRTTPAMRGCDGCKLKQICKPCVGILWAETGDVNRKAPYLCQMSQYTHAQMEKERMAFQGEQESQ